MQRKNPTIGPLFGIFGSPFQKRSHHWCLFDLSHMRSMPGFFGSSTGDPGDVAIICQARGQHCAWPRFPEALLAARAGWRPGVRFQTSDMPCAQELGFVQLSLMLPKQIVEGVCCSGVFSDVEATSSASIPIRKKIADVLPQTVPVILKPRRGNFTAK